MQSIGRSQTFISVRTFHEFIAETGAPFRRICGGLRQAFEVQTAGIIAPNLHGKRIVESEAWSQCQTQTLFVFVLYSLINFSPASFGVSLQNCAQSRAGIFRVNVDAPRQHGLMADIRSGKIKASLHLETSLSFNLLCDEFAENQGLGKVLGANHNAI